MYHRPMQQKSQNFLTYFAVEEAKKGQIIVCPHHSAVQNSGFWTAMMQSGESFRALFASLETR
jgi:hypothetical protein